MAPWIIGIVVTVLLAMLAYLIRGLLAWGSVTVSLETRLQELSAKTATTAEDVKEIRAAMLRPEHLQLAVANLRIEVMKETIADMGAGRRASDRA
jgi:hypothetical protein